MRILIISDTHGRSDRFQSIVEQSDYDAVFHLGDCEGTEERLEKIFTKPLRIVRGNCDIFSKTPLSMILEIAGANILLTHGHKYGVKSGLEYLLEKAKEQGVRYVFFGHTHIPVITEMDGVVLANPGSLTYPKDEKGGSFIVMDVDRYGEIHLSLDYIR